MVDVPVLTDGVVTLRAHSDDDLERVVEQAVDPLSVRWTVVPSPYSLDDAKQFVRHAMPGGWASDREWGFAVEFDGRFGGTVSLRNRDDRRAEIAYGAHPDVRGRGVMERALRLLLDWGFSPEVEGGRELETVVWLANEGNWGSRRLAWRVGFSFDGTLRGWLPHRGELVDAWTGTLRRGEEMTPRHEWFDVPRIVGARVVLRRPHPDDRERLLVGANDPLTAHWIFRMPAPYTDVHADHFFTLRDLDMAAGTAVHWVMADPDTDAFLGTISVLRIERPSGEIGYWAHPDARGRGVVTEAVRLASRHAFVDLEDGGLGLRRVFLRAAVDNTASCGVAERAGFTRMGTERLGTASRQGPVDCAVYDLLPGDPSR
jgi:RimJ/RimL family protein N-acetyltransferase